jgi:hypothetical protein
MNELDNRIYPKLRRAGCFLDVIFFGALFGTILLIAHARGIISWDLFKEEIWHIINFVLVNR